MRSRIAVFVIVIQSILLLAHWFLYDTWTAFWGTPDPSGTWPLKVALALLSVSFVIASLWAWRSSHTVVRVFYTISAVWLGALSFLFLAACSCWALYGGARLLGLHPDRRALAAVLFGFALLASVYGVVNAAWTRVKRVRVKLPNLPEAWRGRVAALVSDTHLGHVHGAGFVRRIVAMLTRLRPDIVFIGGDMYDGTAAKVNELAAPWAKLAAPWGAYFVTGNHEEFSDHTKYLDAVQHSGVRILNNEKVTVDGLQIVGVHYRDSTNDDRLRTVLRQAGGGSGPSQHPAHACSGPFEHRRGRGYFLTAFRSYAWRTVFPFYLDHKPALRQVCLWIAAPGQSSGLYLVRRRHLGTAITGGNDARNRAAAV